jgi:hypothetical protein
VTVESPCEGMSRLRDAHDTQRALAALAAGSGGVGGTGSGASLLSALAFAARLCKPATESSGGADGSKADSAPPSPPPPAIADLSTEGVAALRHALRITAAQAHRVHETLLLAASVDTADEASLRAFRLLVKRRVFATDPDVRAIADADDRKRALEDAFQDAFAQAVLAARRVGVLPLTPPEPVRDGAVERYLQRRREE